MGDIWMGLFKLCFDKIAAELFDKTHMGFELEMLGSKNETVLRFERYAGVRLI